jgi:hypothetical protein
MGYGAAMANPFKPTFGASPPVLAGRDRQIADFADALDDGPGAAGRATLYTGARGSGKTVMLNAIEDEARSRGWLVVSETANENLVETLTRSRLPALLREIDPDAVTRRLTHLDLPVVKGGVSLETVEAHAMTMDLRAQVSLITDLLAENQTGLLLTVDEIGPGQTDQLRQLAIVIQHAFREDRQLAFAGAGLSSAVSDLLNDEVLTFLRRADRHELGSVDLESVRRAIQEPVEQAGRSFQPGALEVMADGTGGYPFLIQLVGSQCWRVRPGGKRITKADAESGTRRAHLRLGSLVHEPALKGLSDIDKSYLLKMAEDDGDSRTSEIAKRLGTSVGYAGVYRDRLIAHGLIEARGRGYVGFTLPYLREYLRDHAASLAPRR